MKRIAIIIYVLGAITLSTHAQKAKDIAGEWYTKAKRSVVRISPNHNQTSYDGKVIWVEDKDNQEFVGRLVVKNIVFQTNENHYIGMFYLPKQEKYVNGIIVVDRDELIIQVEVQGKSRSVKWKRKEQ